MQNKKLERLLNTFPELEEALENLLLKQSSEFSRDFNSNLETVKDRLQEIYYEKDSDDAYLIDEVEPIINYHFNNEKLLVQAFTRRSINLDYNNQVLEFIGDKVLDYVVIKNLDKLFCEVDPFSYEYKNSLNEGELTKIKERFVSKDYLSNCADKLGLSKYIKFSSSELNDGMINDASPKEDLIEAIIGAVAIDTNWDYDVLEELIDHLLDLGNLKKENAKIDDYERLLNWSQKFKAYYNIKQTMIDRNQYKATLSVKYKDFDETIECTEDSRVKARISSSHHILCLLESGGYLYDIRDSQINPEYELSINQLQELYQKKYISKPIYEYKDNHDNWLCTCTIETLKGIGIASTKIEAKKKASLDMLNILFTISNRNK